MGDQDVLVAPLNNLVGGATAPPAAPVPAQSRAYGLRLN